MCALRELSGNTQGSEVPVHYTELLYAHDFPLWFVAHAENYYHWNWQRILFELKDGRFFSRKRAPRQTATPSQVDAFPQLQRCVGVNCSSNDWQH
jgi:hypothetical protein